MRHYTVYVIQNSAPSRSDMITKGFMAKSIEEARRMWLNGLETQSKPKVKLTPEAVDLLESRWEMTEHGTHLVDELISFIVLPGDYDNNMDVERYWELYL